MEIRLTIKLVILWKTIILLGIIVLLSACFHSEKEAVPSIGIVPDEHMLLAITPDFSIKMVCHYYEPADDVEALAAAILAFFKEPENGEALEDKSKEMLKMYDYQKIAAQYMELFRECL